MWSEVLKENARMEFEQARHERDPETISRLLVGGRGALNQAMEKAVDMSKTAPPAGGAHTGGGSGGNRWGA